MRLFHREGLRRNSHRSKILPPYYKTFRHCVQRISHMIDDCCTDQAKVFTHMISLEGTERSQGSTCLPLPAACRNAPCHAPTPDRMNSESFPGERLCLSRSRQQCRFWASSFFSLCCAKGPNLRKSTATAKYEQNTARERVTLTLSKHL